MQHSNIGFSYFITLVIHPPKKTNATTQPVISFTESDKQGVSWKVVPLIETCYYKTRKHPRLSYPLLDL